MAMARLFHPCPHRSTEACAGIRAADLNLGAAGKARPAWDDSGTPRVLPEEIRGRGECSVVRDQRHKSQEIAGQAAAVAGGFLHPPGGAHMCRCSTSARSSLLLRVRNRFLL